MNVSLLEKYKEYRRVSGPTHAKTTTVNIEFRGLKIMMNRAVQWGLINQNPATSVKLLKITDAPRPRFLSENECQFLLKRHVNLPEYILIYQSNCLRGSDISTGY